MIKEFKFMLSKPADSNFCHSLISKLKDLTKSDLQISLNEENEKKKINNFKIKRSGVFLTLTTQNNEIIDVLKNNKKFDLFYKKEENKIEECECYLVSEKEVTTEIFEEGQKIKLSCDNFVYSLKLDMLLKYLNISFDGNNKKIKTLNISLIKDNQIRKSLYVEKLNIKLKEDERIVNYIKLKLKKLFKNFGVALDFSTLNLKQNEQDLFFTNEKQKRIFNNLSISFEGKIVNKNKFDLLITNSIGSKNSYGFGFFEIM